MATRTKTAAKSAQKSAKSAKKTATRKPVQSASSVKVKPKTAATRKTKVTKKLTKKAVETRTKSSHAPLPPTRIMDHWLPMADMPMTETSSVFANPPTTHQGTTSTAPRASSAATMRRSPNTSTLHKSLRERMPVVPLLFSAAFIVAALSVVFWASKTDLSSQRIPADAEVERSFSEARGLSLADRMNYWSGALMRYPTLLSSIKEHSVNDTAPLIPDSYDCTTFVETVASLAKSDTVRDFLENLVSIRYRNGAPSFETRNHFPEADWIPNNVAVGNLTDLTASVATQSGIKAARVSKIIRKREWFARAASKSRAIASVISNSGGRMSRIPETVEASVGYIPIENIESAVDNIPSGSILNIVHPDRPGKEVLISHQGVLIKRSGQVFFRHASRGHAIMEEPFSKYVANQRARTWKVLGFNVVSVQAAQ